MQAIARVEVTLLVSKSWMIAYSIFDPVLASPLPHLVAIDRTLFGTKKHRALFKISEDHRDFVRADSPYMEYFLKSLDHLVKQFHHMAEDIDNKSRRKILLDLE